jgi:hypothetical protein
MDWHIHSRHSPCGKPEATLELILREARVAGITALGVTDHLNCKLNEPALRAARQEYDTLSGKDGFLFGLEVCCLRRYDLDEADRLGPTARVNTAHATSNAVQQIRGLSSGGGRCLEGIIRRPSQAAEQPNLPGIYSTSCDGATTALREGAHSGAPGGGH